MHSSMTGPRYPIASRASAQASQSTCRGRAAGGCPAGRRCRGRGSSAAVSRRRGSRNAAVAVMWAWPVSRARASLGAVDLGHEGREVGHPAPRVDAGRHVLDAERRRRCPCAWSASAIRPRPARRGGRETVFGVGEAAGVDDEARPPGSAASRRTASGRRPRPSASPGSRRAEVDPRGPDRLAAPAAVGAVDRETGVGDLVAERCGSGNGRQSGRISRTVAPSRRAMARSIGEVAAGEPVGDHRAERGGAARRAIVMGRCPYDASGGETPCRGARRSVMIASVPAVAALRRRRAPAVRSPAAGLVATRHRSDARRSRKSSNAACRPGRSRRRSTPRRVLVDREGIRLGNPQRFEMEQLTAIVVDRPRPAPDHRLQGRRRLPSSGSGATCPTTR